jgi:ABC-2 type transport system ATP-binding protein
MNAPPPAVEARSLVRRYGDTTALDDVSFTLEPDRIVGLLGRNGAGKSTLMQLLTAQAFPSSGAVRIFGEDPTENQALLSRTCFVKETQRYPDSFRVGQVLRAASWSFPNWDQAFADALVSDFRLPLRRRMKKLSRGQLSAVGVIVGLASRAPLTLFDEPYLGLDAVARQIFYDRLLGDFAKHPRTVLLSTHLIDEVADLLEHVLLLDEGRLVLDDEAEALRGRALEFSGRLDALDRFTLGRSVLRRETLGSLGSATVLGPFSSADLGAAQEAGLDHSVVGLQQLVVGLSLRPDIPNTRNSPRAAMSDSELAR